MITAKSITGGDSYLSKHLRANDYYAEGEKVEGEWVGKGAEMLGLEGVVDSEDFDKLRNNQHPKTGEKLTARTRGTAKGLNRKSGKLEERGSIALHDITFSAPKAASVAAIIGGDDRIREAWQQSVRLAVAEMEQFAAVRLRTGEFTNSEKLRISGNVAGALFFHDASRALDPQLHAHAVMANASYDGERGGWLALQRRAMMEASPYVREYLYHVFARKLTGLGYRVESAHKGEGFSIAGISEEAERAYSLRTIQREAFEERYKEMFGHRANKRRIENFLKDIKGAAEARFNGEYKAAFGKAPSQSEVDAFVVDWRDPKLTEISTPEVREQQRARLDHEGLDAIEKVVTDARERSANGVQLPLTRNLKEAAQMGLDHHLERTSVPRLGDTLAAALRFGSEQIGDVDPLGLYEVMRSGKGAISDGYEITTEQVLAEEKRILYFNERHLGHYAKLGDVSGAQLHLLDKHQKAAIEALADSQSGISVLIGDAGVGKTRAMERLEEAHRCKTGHGMIALAPTTQATDGLKANGFPEAATIATFLHSDHLQAGATQRALLIDEAGAVSTRQLSELVRIADEREARLVLVGDPKQHESVERGSALRSLIDSGVVKPQRLTEVRRQELPEHRKLAKLLADGRSFNALKHAEFLGMVEEIPDAYELFGAAAKRYADGVEAGRETLVVIPTWNDIESFNLEARTELKKRGLIHGEEIEIRGSASLSWTEVERRHWQDYEPGMVLNFHRPGAGMKAGQSATVKSVLKDGVIAERPDGSEAVIKRKQSNTYDVAEERNLDIAVGDELLFRSNCPGIGVANGERLRVEAVDSESKAVTLAGGKMLPADFTQVCHGHAVTSHKSQGASVQQSMLVVGPESLGASNLRQFYVSNTRFKEDHHLYAHDLAALKGKVATRSERLLAREFVADIGKELGALLKEAEESKGKAPAEKGDARAVERERKIKELLKAVGRHEERAGTTVQFRAFWDRLGGRLLPERIQKWVKKNRRERLERHRRKKALYYARSLRKARQVARWMKQAGNPMRSTGRRR